MHDQTGVSGAGALPDVFRRRSPGRGKRWRRWGTPEGPAHRLHRLCRLSSPRPRKTPLGAGFHDKWRPARSGKNLLTSPYIPPYLYTQFAKGSGLSNLLPGSGERGHIPRIPLHIQECLKFNHRTLRWLAWRYSYVKR